MTADDRPAEPRLLALRLQGFKSFAERTSVEFGPGISAVVGPNGSGKSNLADALRWALGEQGRALRSRKSEDVIWAGSEKRAAQGMADVTLVLDNADGLLPVDFQVLELGRRLYRSGENDYLLNKSRIRLRDLVDLLDAAHLADNAFLFIGQGMVDQALALRPEERRPLFEEVAGVRRHERRRRRAEEQLVESEANLARVEDILGELRPQARRLAAQAEQQASRETTADELATALLATMHARWHDAAARLATADAERDGASRAVDRAMGELAAAETAAAALSAELGVRAALERERREAHDAARATATSVQLRDARLASDLEALERDRRRLLDERAAAEAEMATGRRAMAVPVPARDLELEGALAEAERELADALAELGTLRTARQAQGEELAALRRAAAARGGRTRDRPSTPGRHRTPSGGRDGRGGHGGSAAGNARGRAWSRRAPRWPRRSRPSGPRRPSARRPGRAPARPTQRPRPPMSEPCPRAPRRRRSAPGSRASRRGSRTRRRAASPGPPVVPVVAAWTRTSRSIRRSAPPRRPPWPRRPAPTWSGRTRSGDWPGSAGTLVVSERAVGTPPADDARERRFREALGAAGGGTLDAAVRRDPTGAARRLLARAGWLPDLAACLAVQATMPPGWIVVVRDGSAVMTDLGVTFGAVESVLERRAEAERLGTELAGREGRGGGPACRRRPPRRRGARRQPTPWRRPARTRVAPPAPVEPPRRPNGRAPASSRLSSARRRGTRRRRSASPRSWSAPVWRSCPNPMTLPTTRARILPGRRDDGADGAALAAWESRAATLRARRDRLAEESGAREAARRDAENRRARAEASTLIAEERMARAERDVAALGERERALTVERDALRAELATTAAREAGARQALADVHAADVVDRERLAAIERDAAAARERLRAVDGRLRAADHQALEARLGLEALHEGVVVDLAGLGELAIRRLAVLAGVTPGDDTVGAGHPAEPADAAGRPRPRAARRRRSDHLAGGSRARGGPRPRHADLGGRGTDRRRRRAPSAWASSGAGSTSSAPSIRSPWTNTRR